MALKKTSSSATTATDERSRERDPASLIAALDDPDPRTRRWAARDLAAQPQACAALVARLPLEHEPSVLEVMLTSLTVIGDHDAITGLTDCLRSDDPKLRNAAIEAMKQLPEEVAPMMTQLLEDADPDVRIFAVNILESLRHPQVEDWLIRVIGADAHVNVCATAVDLLGEVGSERAVPALHALKERFGDEPYIQFAADLALRRVSAD